MNVRQIVYDRVKAVAEQQGKTLPPLADDLGILEAGMDSLCVAILIANLDDELHVKPFDQDEVDIPVTFGDLVHVYESAAENAAA